jgi:alkanesulfonate monooxygenase SsuD/methylene tetrahydromethanopterin reductase-like flavin-dependent oxidoreductase (luciferase family)
LILYGYLKGFLWPLSPQSAYPGNSDGSLPVDAENILDLLETLTYVAANTNKTASGTSVNDMLFNNPIILAKRFSALEVLSEGSVIACLGVGWSKGEYQVSNIF